MKKQNRRKRRLWKMPSIDSIKLGREWEGASSISFHPIHTDVIQSAMPGWITLLIQFRRGNRSGYRSSLMLSIRRYNYRKGQWHHRGTVNVTTADQGSSIVHAILSVFPGIKV